MGRRDRNELCAGLFAPSAWQIDREGFKSRMEQYLKIANKRGIKTIFVFFDDCWKPTYQSGKQPEPKPGVHNSGWIQDPGDMLYQDSTLMPLLEEYVKDVMTRLRTISALCCGICTTNPVMEIIKINHCRYCKKYLSGAGDPSFTAANFCCWKRSLKEITQFELENSDIITYHTYDGPADHQVFIDMLKLQGRPMVCTEYMARNNNSLFQNILPMLKEQNIGAINWGLVTGKTNTEICMESGYCRWFRA